METIGSRIKAERNLAGMTQEETARNMDINRATLAKYESGAIDPPSSMLEKLAEVLKCSPAKFFPECPSLADYVRPIEKTLDEITETCRRLNDKGLAEAIKRIKELVQLPQYTD